MLPLSDADWPRLSLRCPPPPSPPPLIFGAVPLVDPCPDEPCKQAVSTHLAGRRRRPPASQRWCRAARPLGPDSAFQPQVLKARNHPCHVPPPTPPLSDLTSTLPPITPPPPLQSSPSPHHSHRPRSRVSTLQAGTYTGLQQQTVLGKFTFTHIFSKETVQFTAHNSMFSAEV